MNRLERAVALARLEWQLNLQLKKLDAAARALCEVKDRVNQIQDEMQELRNDRS